MARKSLKIGNIEFKSQQEAINHFKKILNDCRKNETIVDESHAMLFSLVERHPDAIQKIGCGIKRFYKAPAEGGTSCFWIERNDGSKTDFSFYKAVKAKSNSLYQEFSEACRKSVQYDLVIAKEEHFRKYAVEEKVKCEVSGDKVAIYECHLDHKSPFTFQVIVESFITANKIEISSNMLSIIKDGQFQTEFLDLKIKELFREYHNKIAKLRIVKSNINLSLSGSQRVLKSKQPVKI